MTTTYQCQRCGYSTTHKSCFKAHIYKNTACPGVVPIPITDVRRNFENSLITPYQCQYCNGYFASRQSKSSHQKRCKKIVHLDEEQRKQLLINNILSTNTPMVNNVVLNNSNTNSNNNITIQNIMVNIRDFQDDQDLGAHIDHAFKTQCYVSRDIPAIIKQIYFDSSRPENHCVRLKDFHRRQFDVVQDNKWIKHGEDTLKDLVDNGYRVLSTHYRENRDEIDDILHDEGIYKMVKEWFSKVNDDDPNIYTKLKREVLVLFENEKMHILSR